jgi:hypothetical protein
MRTPYFAKAALAPMFFALSAACVATSEYPDVTEDGLVLTQSRNVDAVYWQEGATLDPYSRVRIENVSVTFRKDWLRDYNRSARGPSGRATEGDMERIKASLAEEFVRVFSKELGDAGYEVTDEKGEDVLVLEPAIVNLDVNAPDLKTPGRSTTYVAEAGEMTLNMALYDSETGAKIGQVIDRKRARDRGRITVSNSVTNRQEAGIILRKWASLLVRSLDEAKEGAA